MKKYVFLTISVFILSLTGLSWAQKEINENSYTISPNNNYQYIRLIPNSPETPTAVGEHSYELKDGTLFINTDLNNQLMFLQDLGDPSYIYWTYFPGLWFLDTKNEIKAAVLSDQGALNSIKHWGILDPNLLDINTTDLPFTLNLIGDGGILAKGVEDHSNTSGFDKVRENIIFDLNQIEFPKRLGLYHYEPLGTAVGLPLFLWDSYQGAFHAQYMKFPNFDGVDMNDDDAVLAELNDDALWTLQGNIGAYSTALGNSNVASGRASFVGGANNQAWDHSSSIMGGFENVIETTATSNTSFLNQRIGSTIVGGQDNIIDGPRNFIGGGAGNGINRANSSAIAGGKGNLIQDYASDSAGDESLLGIGKALTDETHSIILGGKDNINEGRFSAIAGGISNTIGDGDTSTNDDVTYATTIGGIGSTVTGNYSIIAGGSGTRDEDNDGRFENNILSGSYTTVLTTVQGQNQAIDSDYSFLVNPSSPDVDDSDPHAFPAGSDYIVSLGTVQSISGAYNVNLANVGTNNSTYTPKIESDYAALLGGGLSSTIAANSDYSVVINKGPSAHIGDYAPYSFVTEGLAEGSSTTDKASYSVVHGGKATKNLSYTFAQFPGGCNEYVNNGIRTFLFGICPQPDPGSGASGDNLFSTSNDEDLFIISSSYDAGQGFKMRVGINTTAPLATLDVNGKIQAKSFDIGYVDPTGGAYSYVYGYNPTNTYPPYELYKANDIAEIFPTHDEVEPGDIVAINPEKPDKLRKSQSPYDNTVIGVVSYMPAVTFEGHQLVLAENQPITTTTRPAVALSGRVMIKVSLENGPIKRGDLLTSSSIPGVAMRADRIPEAQHAIVAKALQDFTESDQTTGVITGLVMTR